MTECLCPSWLLLFLPWMLTQGLIFLGKKSGILQGNRKKKKVSFSAYYEIKKYCKVAYASFPQFSFFSQWACMRKTILEYTKDAQN